MIDLIYNGLFILLIFKLLMTMYHKRFSESGGYKRVVSLYQSMVLGGMYALMSFVKGKGMNENYILIILILGIVVIFFLRKSLFPYVTKCEICKKKLKLSQILFIDTSKCPECDDFH